MKLIINSGVRYGKLTVIDEGPMKILPSGQTNRTVNCICDCGHKANIRLAHLVRYKTISCGCLLPHHGDTGTRLHNIWRGMVNRIKSHKYIDAHRYIERGIDICEEWNKYAPFKEWALQNGFKPDLQIDRIDNNKGYHPGNCRFVTAIVNANNREVSMMVNYLGITQSLSIILHEKDSMAHYAAIRGRIKRGWNHSEAINTPIKKGNYRRRNELQG